MRFLCPPEADETRARTQAPVRKTLYRAKRTKKNSEEKKRDKDFPGYPEYPAKDDIYNRETEESFDEEGLSSVKKKEERIMSEGLDVPGAELDDDNELIGEEDEENNYYSLGGDDHNDLEEDQGE